MLASVGPLRDVENIKPVSDTPLIENKMPQLDDQANYGLLSDFLDNIRKNNTNGNNSYFGSEIDADNAS